MQEGAAPDGADKPGPPPGEFRLPNLEIVREVARGGFGVVYEAHQSALNRTVAVKILSAQVRDDRVRLRFERECVAMGRLSDHPHIVTVFDAGFGPGGQPYILMDFMPGGNLADQVEHGPVSWREVLATGVKLSAALEEAHRAGVLHRDIKPENVLLSAYGEPELGDFGIARLQGGPETRTGTLTASIAHAAPELLAGDPASVQTDQYALGSTLFVLLSGRPAFVKETDESVLPAIARITSEPVPDLRGFGVPDVVAAVVERLMAKDPAERFATALELATHLQGLQRRLGLPATPIHVADGPGEGADITGRVTDTGPTGGETGTGAGPPAEALDETGAVGPPPIPPAVPTRGLVTGRGLPPSPIPGADPETATPSPPGAGTADVTGPIDPAGTDPADTDHPGVGTPTHDPMDPATIHAPPGTMPSGPDPDLDAAPAPARRRHLPLALAGIAALVLVVAAVVVLGDFGDSPGAQPDPTPTPTPTDSGPAEPDPAEGEGEVLDMSRVIGQIADVRGLEVAGELDVRRYTTAAYAPLIREFAGGLHQGPLEEQDPELRVLTALHQLPADGDYPELVRGVWEERFPAFYDPSTGRVHVRSDRPQLSPFTEAALVDEITLALLDQTYDLETLLDAAEDLDAARAVAALFIGDAQVTSAAWRFRFLEESRREEITVESRVQPRRRLETAPPVAIADITFPLLQGPPFVQAIIAAAVPEAPAAPDGADEPEDPAAADIDEGEALEALEAPGTTEALDAVYADPPTSTTQVIHPERYMERQEPVDVAVTADPGEEWEPLLTRTFGEQDLLLLFVDFPPEAASGAAAGWRGGQLRAWSRGEETIVAVWLESATPEDADAVCGLVVAWYLADPAIGGVGGEQAAPNRFTGDEDGLAVGCLDASPRFAFAPQADQAYELLR